ncbi:zinc finger protein 501-like isoform X1 [Triplophysa dalaica]|uniref:zinc finger protein 501-like isoform X1 n=2 Tax=Triplophysa dalaica TaxID=1582913 RepID=UPI0024DFD28B|nr:zinc finger protein 501-like isoform X1 [Triplophysa dalaica]
MSMMMVQVDVMCCKSVGTDLSMLDIDDLMTEICQLKKEVKLLETKLRERDQLNRKDVCGVSLCDFTDQTSPDLLLSVCNEEQKTSVKLLDCEMELKTQIKEEQTDEGDEIYSDLMKVKEESSEPNETEEKHHHLITGEQSLNCLKTEKNKDKNSHMCPQCGKIFTYKSNLNRHMKVHTGERPYRCDQCGLTVNRESNLNRHMRIHTGEKSYKCDQCGKIFVRKDHLKEHMKTHTGEKLHTCHQCGKIFNRKDHLNEHIRVHTGEKPYRCDQCGKSFMWATSWKDHLLYHSGVRSFQCEQCSKAFISANNLNQHMKIHTGVKPHVCSICGKAFLHLSKLKNHKKKTHTGVGSHMCSEQKSHPSFRKKRRLEIHMKKCCKVHPHETVRIRRSLRSSSVTC